MHYSTITVCYINYRQPLNSMRYYTSTHNQNNKRKDNMMINKEQAKLSTEVQSHVDICRKKYNEIVFEVLNGKHQEAHKMEQCIFSWLIEFGLLLLKLFFECHNHGDYGDTIETNKGLAKRGRTSDKSYFSIFGKLKIKRFLYNVEDAEDKSFAPLDMLLNLPTRCYSYLLSEFSTLLSIGEAYNNSAKILKKFFGLQISTSALETIANDSSRYYTEYYDVKITLPKPIKTTDYMVVSFDGKGVPMIKKEAAIIIARPGKGEKKQKKKEALVGIKYDVNANVRSAEEVAINLVFPEEKKDKEADKKIKAQNIRYIASIEKPKNKVMEEIYKEVINEDFSEKPLVCVMDGALHLWNTFKDVFKDVRNKVFILDIIHVVEYIWIIAHLKHKEGSDACKKYVHEKLLLILQGKVSSYIMELQNELMSTNKKWKKAPQQEKLLKVITYLKNHRQYMKYDEYLLKGYPIGSGIVESACGHLVKNRMEITGARWGINGAEPILKMRSVEKSNDWDEYWKFYTATLSGRKEFFTDDYFNSLNIQHKLCA